MMTDDFIGVYDGALTPAQCEHIRARFDASDKVVRGRTGNGVDTAKKDSYDLTISQHKEWHDVANLMMAAVQQGLRHYMNKYRMLLLGALAPTVAHPKTGEPVALSLANFDEVGTPHIDGLIQAMYRPGAINLQKYLQSGSNCEPLHRVLLFQFYLNDVAEGGETEFMYQQRKVEARQGRLIIAPAGFTHSHKGHVANSSDKYIATSWILFQRAEALYGKA
jgi:hypothetical protein